MVDDNSCAALYRTHEQVEVAIRVLQAAEFDIRKISIVGKSYHCEEHLIGFYKIDDRVSFWGAQGAFWGGMCGAAFFWMPGLGPVVLAGPLVATLVGALEGDMAVGGLSALGVALYSIDIPKDSIIRYEAALNSDQYLIIVHGTQREVERVYEVLVVSESTDVAIHLS
ncbi:MAG: hypothetical protein GXP14_14805 [Gammaproteobacteria bacterium]|nr:hypothetical protein [Gammaproteobacteria bacterium]